MVKGPPGGAALEELTKMVQDLQIAQARRDSEGQARDRKSLTNQRYMWCDAIGHTRSVGDKGVSVEVQATFLMVKNLCTSKNRIQRERERERDRHKKRYVY